MVIYDQLEASSMGKEGAKDGLYITGTADIPCQQLLRRSVALGNRDGTAGCDRGMGAAAEIGTEGLVGSDPLRQRVSAGALRRA